MALSQPTHFKVPPSFDHLTFQGDAFIPTGTSFIRLTKTNSNGIPLPGSVGRVMYSKPFTFWGDGKQVEFETKITFKITPTDNNPADGITFFIAPKGSTIPIDSGGGNLGIFGPSGTGDSIFAVEFDTYSNGWDPPSRHIGINVNSHKSVITKNLDGSFLREVVTLSIKYDQNTITVRAEDESREHHCDLSYELDLSTILENEVQVGISASTGDDMALHDIYYWEFTANMALSQTTHFKMPPFHDLTFQGDAIIPSGTSFIRLTKIDSNGNPLPRRVGRVMYSNPFTFWGDGKQVEFETTIKFKSKPSPTDKYPADGIAFFIAPVGSTIPDGSDGGNLGIFGPDGTGNSIFAVEFDTFSNPWDPPSLHIGIDVNNHKSVTTKNLDDFVLGEVVTLSIKYDQVQAKNTITVRAENESGEHYDIPPYELDLRTILKKEVQVGISASTGDDIAVHDIYDWEFTANMIPVDGAGIRQVVST